MLLWQYSKNHLQMRIQLNPISLAGYDQAVDWRWRSPHQRSPFFCTDITNIE
jgi:hypothetical protein